MLRTFLHICSSRINIPNTCENITSYSHWNNILTIMVIHLNHKRIVRNSFRDFSKLQLNSGINSDHGLLSIFCSLTLSNCYICQALRGTGSLQRKEDEDQQQQVGQNHPRIIAMLLLLESISLTMNYEIIWQVSFMLGKF